MKLIIRELERGLECESQEEFEDDKWELDNLVCYLLRFLQIFAKCEFSAEGKNPCISVLLQKISWLYPRETKYGNTLLHLAVDGENSVIKPPYQFPYAKTVKLLLIAAINVNAFNNNGDKPLHRAVTVKPSKKILTEVMEVLLDGGAHHYFVNSSGKTAMDIAQTNEARKILSKREMLELKCITARAVKMFGLNYVGVVPKTLKKFISMH